MCRQFLQTTVCDTSLYSCNCQMMYVYKLLRATFIAAVNIYYCWEAVLRVFVVGQLWDAYNILYIGL